jgi:hypothetical protein
MNTMVVSITTLYYFFVWTAYIAVRIATALTELLPNVKDLPLPAEVIEKLVQVQLGPSIQAVLIVPLFVSLGMCLLQIYGLSREVKTHLKQLYKGRCDFVRHIREESNARIASDSFHFGGYVTGYLVWGYFIIYLFIVFVGVVVLVLRLFVDSGFWIELVLKLVPVVVVLVARFVFMQVMSGFVFLNRSAAILAIDNFRAFNVFLYFNFFFDIFLGFLSAIVRLVKSGLLAVFMMPSKSLFFSFRPIDSI